MEITKIQIRKKEKEGSRLKAFSSITLDDEFAVHDIRVIEGDSKLFMAMPSRKSGDGPYRDVAHPVNQATRTKFEELILDAYDKTGDEDRIYEFAVKNGKLTEIEREL